MTTVIRRYVIRDGKLVRLYRLDASKRRRIYAQATREAEKWMRKSKPKSNGSGKR